MRIVLHIKRSKYMKHKITIIGGTILISRKLSKSLEKGYQVKVIDVKPI